MKLLDNVELWSTRAAKYMIVVTTNSVIVNGSLVMGAGSALQARELYPAVTRLAARKIMDLYRGAFPTRGYDFNFHYGFLPVFETDHGLGIFQTKQHFNDVSCLGTIQKSASMLAEYALAHPDTEFRLPFAGGGLGQRGKGTPPTSEEILDALAILPDNVLVTRRFQQHRRMGKETVAARAF